MPPHPLLWGEKSAEADAKWSARTNIRRDDAYVDGNHYAESK